MTDRDTESNESAGEAKDTDSGHAPVEESPDRKIRRRWARPRIPRNVPLVPVILVLLVLMSGGAAAWMYFERYQPNQRTDPTVARAVVSAASEGTVALLS